MSDRKKINKHKFVIKTLIATLTLTICFFTFIQPLQNRRIPNIEIKVETGNVKVEVPIGAITEEIVGPFITPVTLILTLFITIKTVDLADKLMKGFFGEDKEK